VRQLRKATKAIPGAIAMAFTADGKTLIAPSLDQRKIYHWNPHKGAMTRAVDFVDLGTSQPGHFTFWRLSPDGTTFALQPESRDRVVLFDTATGKERFRVTGKLPARRAFAYFRDSKTLLTNLPEEDGNFSLWDTKSGERKRWFKIPIEWNDDFEISPEGKTMLAADGTPTIRLWDMDSGNRLTPRQGHEDLIIHMVVTPDSKTLISSSRDGQIRVWDFASSRIMQELPPVRNSQHGIALRPSTNEVAVWTWEGVIQFYDWRSGQESRRIDINDFFDNKEPSNPGSRRFLYGVECSPDGSRALIFVGQMPGAPPCA
jgi:WD40 repeat protein